MDYVTWIIVAIVVLIIISIVFTIPCWTTKKETLISDARADALIRDFRANLARGGNVMDFRRANDDVSPYVYAQMVTLYNNGRLNRAGVRALM